MSFVVMSFPAEISKTGCCTNVVCCEVKILHSEHNPGPNAVPNSFKGERRPAFFLSFFLSCFSFPRFVAWPLELGLGNLNPRFVAWPLELGLGNLNPRFVVWPLQLGLGNLNPRFVAWPLELGLGTRNPRFVAWPLELGLGTRNPRFVACMVVESRNGSLGRRQKELAANKKEGEKGNDLKRPYGSGHPVWLAKRWQANEGW